MEINGSAKEKNWKRRKDQERKMDYVKKMKINGSAEDQERKKKERRWRKE